jgi:hypothetical protein
MPRTQLEIPGTEKPTISDIEDAAEAYVKLRERWQKLGEQLTTAKTALLTVMQKHAKDLSANGDGDRIYTYDDEIVILKPGQDKVKVKHATTAEEEDDDA